MPARSGEHHTAEHLTEEKVPCRRTSSTTTRLAGDEENRKPSVGITVTVPFRNAEDAEEDWPRRPARRCAAGPAGPPPRGADMRVLLVNMPWSPIDLPSLALGILKRSVDERGARRRGRGPARQPRIHRLDHRAHPVHRRRLRVLRPVVLLHGLRRLVFSSALYDDPHWREEEFTAVMRGKLKKPRMAMTRALHRVVPEFVDEIARRIVAQAPMSSGSPPPSSRTPRRWPPPGGSAQLAPHIVTVLGGANCDGAQGARRPPQLPVRRPRRTRRGEAAFPQLLTALADGSDLAGVPRLCHRAAGGASRANPMATRPLPPAAILPPDYSAAASERPRRLRRPSLGRTQAGRGGRPRLLVGGEAPLHLLRAQRIVHAVPFQEPGHLLRGDRRTGPPPPGPGHVRRGQHPRHGLPDDRAAQDHRQRVRPAAAHRDQGRPCAAPQLRTLADAGDDLRPARHRVAQPPGPGPDGQGRQRLPERPDAP
ncbi:hypothetical protein LT493_03945 [Streptomyces tricolor]|nr:hypothetical protein [Streptomyces tricolor]